MARGRAGRVQVLNQTPVADEKDKIRLHLLTEEVEKKRQAILPPFEEVLVSDPNDAQKLAKHLSTRYPCLRIQILFQEGRESISAVPVFKPFKGYPIPSQVANTEEFLKNVAKHWPSFQEVRAYAMGFNDACPSAQRYKDLQDENDRLKREVRNDRYPGMPLVMNPFPRMY
jgi:hypothetical protein